MQETIRTTYSNKRIEREGFDDIEICANYAEHFPVHAPIDPRSDTLHTARRTYVELHGDPYAIDPEAQQEILETMGNRMPMARTREHLLKLLSEQPAPAVLPPNASMRDVVMGKIASHARHGAIDVDLLAEECAQDPALAHLTQAERWTLVTACMGEYERAKNE